MAIGNNKEINLIKKLIKEMNRNKIEFIKLGDIEIKKAPNLFKTDEKMKENKANFISPEEKRKLEEEELFWSSSP